MSYGFPGRGGDGGNGGNAGGLTYSNVTLTNWTAAFNSSSAGTGGRAGAEGFHQPCCQRGPGTVGVSGTAAFGGVTGGTFVNTLLATNSPASSNRIAIIDLGHNLSSDNSYAFTNTGSLSNTDPMLAPMANNGGSTLTMALLPGSPAIDAADATAAPSADQRGITRPIGPAPDIGAFEYGLPAVLRVGGLEGTNLDIVASAYPGLSCRLLISSNLSDWLPVATNQIGADGTVHFSCDGSANCSFYRVVTP